MSLLRLNVRFQTSESLCDEFLIVGQLVEVGQTSTESGHASFRLSGSEARDLRWYWEEYGDSTRPQADTAARRVEGVLPQIGSKLFNAVFPDSSALFSLWKRIRKLSDLRVEISAEDIESSLLPWELIRSDDGSYLAIEASQFVRVVSDPQAELPLPQDKLRLLLIVARPFMASDVSYQTVAHRILKTLQREVPTAEVSFLRPPTFDRLEAVLREAASQGNPFQVVHFDGHGEYVDATELSPDLFATPPPPGRRGYVLFERPLSAEINSSTIGGIYISGEEYGRTLHKHHVCVGTFNSCRSAYASGPNLADVLAWRMSSTGDPLATEVLKAGLSGVVAMRYSVYVDSAAAYLAELYRHLAEGADLSVSASMARKLLHNQGATLARNNYKLQDWAVPVCYERGQTRLVKQRSGEITVAECRGTASSSKSQLTSQERCLFFLDRAFDHTNFVVLYGMRGAGKTTTGEQFASWYEVTQGASKIIWSRWTAAEPAEANMARIGKVFREELLSDADNLTDTDYETNLGTIKKALRETDILWIWDGIGDFAALDAGGGSTKDTAICTFVRMCVRLLTGSRVKVLLLSHADIEEWLFGRVASANILPLDKLDSMRLLEDESRRASTSLVSGESLDCALEWASGNLSAVRLVSLKTLTNDRADEGLRFVIEDADLDLLGCAAMRDAASKLVTRLGDTCRDSGLYCLRIICLFRGTFNSELVDAYSKDVNRTSNEMPWRKVIKEIAQSGFAVSTGLLTSEKESRWLLHPMLDFLVHQMGEATSSEEERHFVRVHAAVGTVLRTNFVSGTGHPTQIAAAELPNFKEAFRHARKLGMDKEAIGVLRGITLGLCFERGENDRWTRFAEELLPEFVESDFSDFRPNCEENGLEFLEIYVEPLVAMGRLEDVKRALALAIPRQRLKVASAPRSKSLTEEEHSHVFRLFTFLKCMGRTMAEEGDSACLEYFKEAFKIAVEYGQTELIASALLEMGAFDLDLAQPPDLDRSNDALKLSLSLRKADDVFGQGCCHFRLGDWFRVGWTSQLIEISKQMAIAHSYHAESTADVGIPNRALREYEYAIGLLSERPCLELCRSHRRVAQLCGIVHLLMPGVRSLDYLDKCVAHFDLAAELSSRLGNKLECAKVRLEAADFLNAAHLPEEAQEQAKAACESHSAIGRLESTDLLRAVAEIHAFSAGSITIDGTR